MSDNVREDLGELLAGRLAAHVGRVVAELPAAGNLAAVRAALATGHVAVARDADGTVRVRIGEGLVIATHVLELVPEAEPWL